MRNQLFPVPLSLHTLSFTGTFCMISWQPLHSCLITVRFKDRMSQTRDDELEMLLVKTVDLLDFLNQRDLRRNAVFLILLGTWGCENRNFK